MSLLQIKTLALWPDTKLSITPIWRPQSPAVHSIPLQWVIPTALVPSLSLGSELSITPKDPASGSEEVRLMPGSAKEPPRRARSRQGLKLPQRAPAMIHGSSVGKRENQKITGKELKRPKALLQTGKKISHSQKYFTFTCTEGCVLGAPCPTY